MTVAELIAELSQYPRDWPVVVQHDGLTLTDPMVQTEPVNVRRWSTHIEYISALHPAERDAMAVMIV